MRSLARVVDMRFDNASQHQKITALFDQSREISALPPLTALS
jgi:hypothetical protein